MNKAAIICIKVMNCTFKPVEAEGIKRSTSTQIHTLPVKPDWGMWLQLSHCWPNSWFPECSPALWTLLRHVSSLPVSTWFFSPLCAKEREFMASSTKKEKKIQSVISTVRYHISKMSFQPSCSSDAKKTNLRDISSGPNGYKMSMRLK